MVKEKLKSWTLWVNAASALAVHVLEQLSVVSPETAWIATALVVANFGLRFKTTQPIVGS